MSVSQSSAGICHCTLLTISKRHEPTLCTPLLPFRRWPSQSNYPPCMVLDQDWPDAIKMLSCYRMMFHWRLDPCLNKRVIANHLLCAVILISSVQGCSKGARGLSVLPQIPRIFTGISISLSLCWRQRGSRYVIHAGRNLPDKGFRYLWTVIVTAAVYWCLGHMLLKHLGFTCQHRADVRLYTSSYDFAESCVFGKQSLPLIFLFWLWLPIEQTMFLPKLHMQFAEFLQHNYLIHLSILYPTTCVSSWYGHKIMDCFLPGNSKPYPTIVDRTTSYLGHPR